ncbi:hypothetical protein A2160_01790 [Candidatus Beckwithbacteria bacterium RBG_13_42_9]|uniref:HAD family hydrolase n=1 Tax=Candidatus Beckwithbacteria bacterium RBG_13_42_9 TaxID=1797457 RepID=A0A1F5E895_9BACT|nr:MAG: hypothetical protein A2160_01790 [Candidatus Beckwithbacteria bacterium RBG_13_42_9]
MNLIFDFDGIIVDSQTVYNRGIFHALKQAGFDYTLAQVEDYTNFQYFETISLLAKEKAKEIEELLVKDILKQVKEKDFLFPGVQKALKKLAARNKLYIASNSREDILHQTCQFYKLPFTAVIGRTQKFKTKPPALNWLIKEHNLDKGQSAYVGDSVQDIRLARNAEMMAIAVATGWDSKERLAKGKPDKLYSSLTEMAEDKF